MNQSFGPDLDSSSLEHVLVDCLSAIDRGEIVNVKELVERFPEHADELSSFFASAELVEQMAGPTNQEYLARTQSIDTSRIVDQGHGTLVSEDLEQRTATWMMPHEFGRYRLLERLGTGAMGSVFRAHDARLGRDVAIKIPRHEFQQGSELQLRFEREAKAAAAIQHRNICPVYDVGEINGIEYIAMSFLSGQTLEECIRRKGPCSQAEAIRIVRKLAEALSAAHKQNVIHRDLKPANVMIDDENEPVIMDFGLALQGSAADQIRVTQHGTIVGTPAYMAPEQIDATIHEVGPNSDIYSLGVMFYELLTGQLPFDGPLTSVVNQVLTKRPTSPRQIDPSISKAINSVCLKMLEKDPKQRFESMEDVVEALSTTGLADRRWPLTKYITLGIASITALIITGLVIWSGKGVVDSKGPNTSIPAAAEKSDQRAAVALSKQEPATLLFQLEGHESVVSSVMFSPSGKYLASAGRGKDVTIRLWEVSTGKLLQTLAGLDDHESFPRFSPDGSKLAAVGNGGLMKVWELPSLKEVWSIEKPSGIMSAAYLPDDRLLTYGDYNQQLLRLWELSKGNVVRSYHFGGSARRHVQLSRDFKRLVLPLGEGELVVLNVSDFAEIARFQMPDDPVKSFDVAGALSRDGQRVALSHEGNVAVWNVETKELLHHWKEQGFSISLEFTPDGRHLIHAPRHGDISIFNVESGRSWKCISQAMSNLTGLAVAPDGRSIALGGASRVPQNSAGIIQVWQLPKSVWPEDLLAANDLSKSRERVSEAENRGKESDELVQQARELIQRGQHNQAAKKLEQAIKLDPQNAEAHYQRALCSIPWSDHDKNAHHFTSMRYLDKAIKLDRQNALYVAERGLYLKVVADKRNDDTIRRRAIADLTAAITLKNDIYLWWFERAWMRSGLAEHDGADKDYRRVIELLQAKKQRNNREQTDLAFAYLNNCDNLIRKGDITGAMQMGDQAIAVGPGIPKTHWNRARAYKLHHDYPTALEALDQAIITTSGRYSDAFLLKTEIHDVFDELPQARDNAALALQTGGGPQAARSLAAFENALGRYDVALFLLGKVREASPDDAWAAFGQALSLSYAGDFDKALDSYADAIKLDPENVIFLTSRAFLLRYLRRNADANQDERKVLSLLDQRIKKDNSDTDALQRRALLRFNQGRLDDSMEDWNRLVALDPRDVFGLAYLSLLLSSHPDDDRRDPQRALKLAKSLTEITLEKRAFFLSVRAAAHAENGDWKEAVSWQKKALDSAPLTEYAEFAKRLALYGNQKPFRMENEPSDPSEIFADVVVPKDINVANFDALQPRAVPKQPLPPPIIAKQRPATVLIKSDQGFGTGMILDPKGFVLTCAHVLPYSGEVTIHYDDGKGSKAAIARPIAINHRHDLALLKFDPPKDVALETIQLGFVKGQPVSVAAGGQAVVIGNPGDGNWVLQKVVLPGSITSDRQMLGDFIQRPYIQVQANVSPGCSGGPLLDDRGRVVGVIVQKSPTLLQTGFAVPMDVVARFLGVSTDAN